jgi:hypothetical protein
VRYRRIVAGAVFRTTRSPDRGWEVAAVKQMEEGLRADAQGGRRFNSRSGKVVATGSPRQICRRVNARLHEEPGVS